MIALSYAQLVAGGSTPYLKEVMANRSYIPTSWLSILIPDVWLPHPQWDFDKILIDVFEAKKPSEVTLEKSNMVRLYLSVLTRADIASDDRRNILPWALTGRIRAKQMIPWPNHGMVLWCSLRIALHHTLAVHTD
eukprot:3609259-Ditylum_brightwellii.AAC.1